MIVEALRPHQRCPPAAHRLIACSWLQLPRVAHTTVKEAEKCLSRLFAAMGQAMITHVSSFCVMSCKPRKHCQSGLKQYSDVKEKVWH